MEYLEIKSYVLNQYAGASANGLIYLYDTNNHHIGNAYFVRQDSVPEPMQDSFGFYNLYFHDTEYMSVVDMLRNEGPCYLRWYGSSAAISTSCEEVGENELTQ